MVSDKKVRQWYRFPFLCQGNSTKKDAHIFYNKTILFMNVSIDDFLFLRTISKPQIVLDLKNKLLVFEKCTGS